MMHFARSTAAAAAALGFSFTATPSVALPLTAQEILQQFNLVVFGDLSTSSEVEGRAFIGGTLDGSSSNFFIHGNLAPPSDHAALIVGGDVEGGSKQVNNGGDAVVGGNLWTQINMNGGGVRYVAGDVNVAQNGPTVQGPVEIPDFETPLRQLSSDLTGIGANSTATIDGSKGVFAGTPDAGGFAVFWIDGVDFFSSIGELEFLVDGAGTVIVNVSGDVVNIAANFLGGIGEAVASTLLWNFYEATEVNIATAFFGTILAPNAIVANTNSLTGAVVASGFEAAGEIHLAPFQGEIPSTDVPEPETALLLLPGLFGLIALGRRIRTRRATA